MLFPGIVCLILLYVFLQQDSSSEEDTFTITTIPQEQNEEAVDNMASSASIEEPIVEKIMIDVQGAVKSPGVYVLTSDDRIIDAIERAGGYTEEAQSSAVNHAQKLQDEMLIYIPKTDEEINQDLPIGQVVVSSPAASADSTGNKIDLNSADETALTTLPGVGASKAQAIIAFREENGSFKTIDDLKNVSGIGEKTFEKLKEYIIVK